MTDYTVPIGALYGARICSQSSEPRRAMVYYADGSTEEVLLTREPLLLPRPVVRVVLHDGPPNKGTITLAP